MPLTPLKCSDCGATLQVTDNQNIVTCPYCGATFAVTPDINNYNTINNINANVVNITYNVTQQVSSVQETPKTKQSNSQQSSYGNKSNSLTYRTQSDIYNTTHKPLPSKSVAKEYVKEHPEQFSEKSNNMSSGEIDFWNTIGKISESPTGYKIVQGITIFLAFCPAGTLMILVQGKDFVGVEILPIVTVIEIIFAIIYFIVHSDNSK